MFSFIETSLFSRLVQEYLTDEEYWMLTIYPKSEIDSIPGHILKQIREEITDD